MKFASIEEVLAMKVAFLLLPSSLTVADVTNQEEMETLYPQLGTASLDALMYGYDVTVDADCNYALQVQFVHNADFPVGSAETCVPDEIADYDGLPMLAGRYFYEEYPAYVQEATDLNHLSLDYNPCGLSLLLSLLFRVFSNIVPMMLP